MAVNIKITGRGRGEGTSLTVDSVQKAAQVLTLLAGSEDSIAPVRRRGRKRGRPKGSKNKPLAPSRPRKRSRKPKKVETGPTAAKQ